MTLKAVQDQMFSQKEGKLIDTPSNIKDFLTEIDAVCQKYGVSISHEDRHGGFILEPYDAVTADWLSGATLDKDLK